MTERKLKSFDLDGVAEYIKSGAAKKIVLMTGAGISCGAGIPDFRSIGTGLYSNLQKYNLPQPSDVFTLSYFDERPEPFFDLVGSLLPGKNKPTFIHYFARMLNDKKLLLRHYTQNIDGLHQKAGSREVLELHGSVLRNHCMECGKFYDAKYVKESDGIPRCECGGIIKPDVVLYEEGLDQTVIQGAVEAIQKL